MPAMTFALSWSWFLGIALFFPIALPAGGGERSDIEKFSLKLSSNCFVYAGDSCTLQSSPSSNAPSLRTVRSGTPLKPLRRWKSAEQKDWIQVQIASNEIMESPSLARRGWLNV